MTAQEAYAELISIRKNREDGYLTNLSCGGKADEQEERTIKAYSVALNALERQIPKKPIDAGYYYMCPCCQCDLGVSDDDIFIYVLSMPKYCSNCGCVLDWSEVKNNA